MLEVSDCLETKMNQIPLDKMKRIQYIQNLNNVTNLTDIQNKFSTGQQKGIF